MMGCKYIVFYGFYVVYGFIFVKFVECMGFFEVDLGFLFEVLVNMFEYDCFVVCGEMIICKLIVFCYDSVFGNVFVYKLFDLVKVGCVVDGEFCVVDDKGFGNLLLVWKFVDYNVSVDCVGFFEGVELFELL